MKRRKQIGKLIYTPRWEQGDVVFSDDYEGLTREEKLEVLAHWIAALLNTRNAMITNPKSWHHFMGDKSWENLTNAEIGEIYRAGWANNMDYAEAIQKALREKNT